ncbi:hypothetical protein DIPPA_55424 [Diplonema papillatum]|nr:hypothetical protein DIPPA_55424 [Diplonema papillatum]KAJ9454333.1 hypothetical protein DIPPA_55424 [Diplonema papillatum]
MVSDVLGLPASPLSMQRSRSEVKTREQLSQERRARQEEQQRRHEQAIVRAVELREKEQKAFESKVAVTDEKFSRQLGPLEKQKREVLSSRVFVWLQVVCTISPLFSLVEKREMRHATSRLRMLWLPIYLRWRHRKTQSRRRQALLETRKEALVRPSADRLQALEFFDGWQSFMLQQVSNKLDPIVFEAGEYVCMEGDWGQQMYVLGSGTVDVYIRNAKNQANNRKSRSIRECLKVATITSGARSYFGEFSVLCNEPRSATIHAPEDCVLWVLHKAEVQSLMDSLRPKTRTVLLQKADQRRAQNMYKLCPMKAPALAATCPLFALWSQDKLATLCTRFEPALVRAGARIIEEGTHGDALFYLVSGTVQVKKKKTDSQDSDDEPTWGPSVGRPVLRKSKSSAFAGRPSSPKSPRLSRSVVKPSVSHNGRSSFLASAPDVSSHRDEKDTKDKQHEPKELILVAGKPGSPVVSPEKAEGEMQSPRSDEEAEAELETTVRTLGAGAVFGEISLIFPEDRSASVVAQTSCELWKLDRRHLSADLWENPSLFIDVKQKANLMRGAWLPRCPASFWRKAPLLSTLPLRQSFFRNLVAVMTPLVVDATGPITLSGKPRSNCMCIMSGKFKEAKSGEMHEGPVVLGVPEILTRQPFHTTTLKAETRCEIWILPTDVLLEQLARAGALEAIDTPEVWCPLFQKELCVLHRVTLRQALVLLFILKTGYTASHISSHLF